MTENDSSPPTSQGSPRGDRQSTDGSKPNRQGRGRRRAGRTANRREQTENRSGQRRRRSGRRRKPSGCRSFGRGLAVARQAIGGGPCQPGRFDGTGRETRTATAGPIPHRREGDGATATVRGAVGEPGLSDDPKRVPSRPEGVAMATGPMPLGEERARANPLPRRTGMPAGRRRPCSPTRTMPNRLRCSFTNTCGDLPGGITKIERPSSDLCGLPVWSPTPTSVVD